MSEALARAWWVPAIARERRADSAAGAGGPLAAPLVAVLCTPPRTRVAAAGVGLALARATGCSCAIVGAVGAEAQAALGGAPTARRAAMALQRRGLPASAGGRLVWLADRRGPLVAGASAPASGQTAEPEDGPSRAAALSAELGRSAAAVGVPAAVAFPFARTEALDRVLAWHDAIVVVREPDGPVGVIERALASLAALGRPAAAMAPPARLAGLLALAGLGVPAEAEAAVAELTLGDLGRPGPRDA